MHAAIEAKTQGQKQLVVWGWLAGLASRLRLSSAAATTFDFLRVAVRGEGQTSKYCREFF